MALVVYIFLSLCVSILGVSDQRRCADANCEEPISSGVARVAYNPSEGGKLHVKKGEKVVIFSKDAGNDTSLWGVKVRGKRGYMPKDFVLEEKVYHKKLDYIVSTEIENHIVTNLPDNNIQDDVPVISNSFSVVDGTTIYSNTTDEILETQPMETITFNAQNVDIQSSRTIDATNIGKNTLVEPNSSLILPQPTTSSAAVYSADGEEILGGTQASTLDEVKKSSVGTSTLENNEEIPEITVKDIENKFGKTENIEKNEKLEISEENIDAKGDNKEDEDNGMQDGEDEVGDEDLEEEDLDDEDLDDEDLEDEDLEDEDLENEDLNEEEEKVKESEIGDTQSNLDSGNEKNDKESKANNGNEEEDKGVVSGTSEASFQYSEPGKIGDNAANADTSEREKVGISNDTVEYLHKEELKENEASLLKDEMPSTAETSSEAATVGHLDKNVMSHEDGANESEKIGESKEKPVVMPPDSESTIIMFNKEADTKNKYSSDVSSGRDASPEHNPNLSEDGNIASESGSGYANEHIANVDNIQGGDVSIKNNYLHPFSSLGKYNEKDKAQEENLEVHNAHNSVSPETTTVQDSQENDDVYPEHVHTTPSSFDGLTDLHPPVTSDEYSPEQVLEMEQVEKPPAVSPSDDGQSSDMTTEETVIQDGGDNDVDANSKHPETDTAETPPEVQGTCEIHSVGCVPESEDLSKQQFSSDDAEPGWLAYLMGGASIGSDLLVSTSSNKEMHKNSFDTLLYLMVTAITVLVFSLGYYYIEKQRRDGSLIAKINSLEKALMVSSQEKYTLKDELETAKEKISAFITSIDSGETSSVLKEELEECRNARFELEEQVVTLEKELEAATEAGLELNRMMSELLSAQHGSDTLMKSVEHLQKQLDSQQSTISTMTANLTAKNLENDHLQSELKLQLERVQNLEEQLEKDNETLMNLQKEKSEIEHEFQLKNQSIESQLVEALESKSADSQRLCRELDALQDVLDETRKTLAAREGEVSVLRDCLSHVENLSNDGESSISLEDLLNVGHLRAKIDTVTKERDELQEKLQGEEDARKLLEDHMKIVSEEVSTLRSKYEEADRGKMEAQTRLEVLSNYFKEKETQLQKELGLQEAMYIQKEGDALSTIEQIKAFQEEIENYKAQNEILKKEILDQERSMKSQIAVLEKKAHENWVAARQAERRMEESKQEASQLRNRLTMSGRRIVGTIPGPEVGKPPERGTIALEHNGEMSSSPAHMGDPQELPSSPLHFGLPGSPPLLPPGGQPLPPGPFPNMPLFLPPGAPGMPFPMPPPPGGLFPEDLRPPPLGRMSSPPPEPRGSFSPFEHSPPMSPPNRPYRSPPHYEDSPSRYRRQTPPTSSTPSFTGPFSPGKWDERGEPPRSSFRPLHRDPPREPKGPTLSSGHSSESLDKGNRHSRV